MDADGAYGGDRTVGAFGAEPVGGGRHPLHALHICGLAQCGELMEDHLGLGLGHRGGRRVGIARIDDDRFCTERAQGTGLGGRVPRADDLLAARHELGYEPSADVAGRVGIEDLHRISVPHAEPQQTGHSGIP
ncbi:hypothetical protein ABT288_27450 [Streptomyces sp. NPDC001093]|uniref:hypothetical protein n=1 Tax=Streptomyces sp. NPDC001093 TaxID=3154376 RepID=UPI0033315611